MGQVACVSEYHIISNVGDTVAILPNNYLRCPQAANAILIVTIETFKQTGANDYRLAIKIWNTLPVSPSSKPIGSFDILYTTGIGALNTLVLMSYNIKNISKDLAVKDNYGNGSFNLSFTISKELSDKPGTYVMLSRDGFALWFQIFLQYTFSEKVEASTDGEVSTKLSQLKQNNMVQVPEIFINSQTLIDNSDIGNTILQIRDEFQYYNYDPKIINTHICNDIIINLNDIKITRFKKSCPKIVSVLRGVGNTASEKLLSLLNSENIEMSSFTFGENIIKYSMVKYLLARILYGKFDVKYLLRKYNNKFLTDLSHSRFCHFVDFFTNETSELYNYNKYFLFSFVK